MRQAVIDPESGLVENVILAEPGFKIPGRLLVPSDTAGPGDAYDEETGTFTGPPPPDHSETLAAERAGMVCSRFQAKAALHAAGLLDQVEAALSEADPLAKLAWADAVEFRRNSPTIAALAGAIGLTDEQIDDLFRAAMQIEA